MTGGAAGAIAPGRARDPAGAAGPIRTVDPDLAWQFDEPDWLATRDELASLEPATRRS